MVFQVVTNKKISNIVTEKNLHVSGPIPMWVKGQLYMFFLYNWVCPRLRDVVERKLSPVRKVIQVPSGGGLGAPPGLTCFRIPSSFSPLPLNVCFLLPWVKMLTLCGEVKVTPGTFFSS